MGSKFLALSAVAVSLVTALAPPPARAQSTINVCVVNSSGAVLQSSVVYRWQQPNGVTAEASTNWAQTLLGTQHCEAIPYRDLQIETTIQLRAWNFGWVAFCGGGSQWSVSLPVPTRGGTVVASGTTMSATCRVNQ